MFLCVFPLLPTKTVAPTSCSASSGIAGHGAATNPTAGSHQPTVRLPAPSTARSTARLDIGERLHNRSTMVSCTGALLQSTEAVDSVYNNFLYKFYSKLFIVSCWRPQRNFLYKINSEILACFTV